MESDLSGTRSHPTPSANVAGSDGGDGGGGSDGSDFEDVDGNADNADSARSECASEYSECDCIISDSDIESDSGPVGVDTALKRESLPVKYRACTDAIDRVSREYADTAMERTLPAALVSTLLQALRALGAFIERVYAIAVDAGTSRCASDRAVYEGYIIFEYASTACGDQAACISDVLAVDNAFACRFPARTNTNQLNAGSMVPPSSGYGTLRGKLDALLDTATASHAALSDFGRSIDGNAELSAAISVFDMNESALASVCSALQESVADISEKCRQLTAIKMHALRTSRAYRDTLCDMVLREALRSQFGARHGDIAYLPLIVHSYAVLRQSAVRCVKKHRDIVLDHYGQRAVGVNDNADEHVCACLSGINTPEHVIDRLVVSAIDSAEECIGHRHICGYRARRYHYDNICRMAQRDVAYQLDDLCESVRDYCGHEQRMVPFIVEYNSRVRHGPCEHLITKQCRRYYAWHEYEAYTQHARSIAEFNQYCNELYNTFTQLLSRNIKHVLQITKDAIHAIKQRPANHTNHTNHTAAVSVHPMHVPEIMRISDHAAAYIKEHLVW